MHEPRDNVFKKIYNLDVLVIPTHMPMIRKDFPDVIYKTKKEKYEAAIKEIIALHKKGQPVLVGTISIENTSALNDDIIVANFEALSLFSDLLIFENRIM